MSETCSNDGDSVFTLNEAIPQVPLSRCWYGPCSEDGRLVLGVEYAMRNRDLAQHLQNGFLLTRNNLPARGALKRAPPAQASPSSGLALAGSVGL